MIGPEIEKAAQYVADWWALHPQEWRDLNDLDVQALHEYRVDLYYDVNAATEGDLERLLGAPSYNWIIAVGLAAAKMR